MRGGGDAGRRGCGVESRERHASREGLCRRGRQSTEHREQSTTEHTIAQRTARNQGSVRGGGGGEAEGRQNMEGEEQATGGEAMEEAGRGEGAV